MNKSDIARIYMSNAEEPFTSLTMATATGLPNRYCSSFCSEMKLKGYLLRTNRKGENHGFYYNKSSKPFPNIKYDTVNALPPQEIPKLKLKPKLKRHPMDTFLSMPVINY